MRERNNNTAIRVHLNWKNDVEFYCHSRQERLFFLFCHLSSSSAWKSSDCETKENTLLAKWWTHSRHAPPWVVAFVRECPIAFRLWRVTWEKKDRYRQWSRGVCVGLLDYFFFFCVCTFINMQHTKWEWKLSDGPAPSDWFYKQNAPPSKASFGGLPSHQVPLRNKLAISSVKNNYVLRRAQRP